MNHQAQHYVLVDGEWVSRPVDIYQAMARAQDSDSEMPEAAVEPSPQVPEIGILSRTVFASPLFKYVRPANIRHKHLNDIVLIGEDAVHLKEIRDYGRLRHVATKTDFNGRILAAKVFGDPREVPLNIGSPLPKKKVMHRARRSMTGDEEYVLPPEVMVLTLSSRTLIFLWAQHTQTGSSTFMQKTVSLPAGTSIFDRFGTYLAIDPKRRAMAVAAQEGRFIIYKTKSMDRWRNELRDGLSTTPIEDERIILIEGRIMHMDFLSSAVGQDDSHVVLLFIVVVQGKTKMTCFDWDCRENLSKAAVRTERFVVDLEDHNPSLLIPLSRTSEFLLIFDTHIAAYRDILSGDPRRTLAPIDPRVIPSLLPGDSKRRPRWIAWDRTPRNRDYPKEVFYIAREDGRIMYAERATYSLESEEAGDWPYRIDTAFACLNVDNSEFSQLYPDVLFAGGASNDGQLCKVGSWPAEYSYGRKWPQMNMFSPIESIPNWTPMTDLLVSRMPGIRVPHERQRDSIFVSNGASPHGEVSELRYGIQASVENYSGGMNGCTGLWVVDHGCNVAVDDEGKSTRRHYATFAVTLPPETLLIRIVRTQLEIRTGFSGAWEDGTWDIEQISVEEGDVLDGVIREVETIAACSWNDDVAIQITRNGIRSLSRPRLRETCSITYDDSLLRAACRPSCPWIVSALRASGEIRVEMTQLLRDGTLERAPSNVSLQLDHDPTCIEIFQVESATYVFYSTFDSKVGLLRVEDDGTLLREVEDTLENAAVDGARVLLESAVLLQTSTMPILVCATRSGFLLSSQFPTKGSRLKFGWHTMRLGTTSAKITMSSTDPSTAFVSCGPDFCLIRPSANDPTTLDVKSIWFTKTSQPDYMQSPVTAMFQLPNVYDLNTVGRNLGGLLFTVAGDQLLFSQVEMEPYIPESGIPSVFQNDCRAIPRKLITGAKPTYLAYLESPRKIVIATMEAKEGRPPPHGYRVLHSFIKLLNPTDEKALDDAEIKQEDDAPLANKLVAAEFELKHGERVYSIAEWPFEDTRGKKHHLLIVGTGIPSATGKETGRRLILNTGKQGSKLQLQKESSFDHPVYCTAVMSNLVSISAIGKCLTLDVFKPEDGLLKKRATINLPSPAIDITIRATYIYVSTLQHSHHCFVVIDDEADGSIGFKKIFEDSKNRNCSNHLVVDIPTTTSPNTATTSTTTNTDSKVDPTTHTMVLVSDKSSASLSALYHSPQRTYKSAAPTLFEACLPRTVVRLQEGDVRPSWRRPIAPLTGILKDGVVGACSDGTIYGFTILDENSRHLLKFLQTLIEEKAKRDPSARHTPVNPRTGAIADVLMNGAEGDQEPDSLIHARTVDSRHQHHNNPKAKHIDGDVLARWLEEDGDLEGLVGEGTEGQVRRVYKDLVGEMWEGGRGAGGVREWVGRVVMALL